MIHHVTREVSPAALAPCLAFYELLGFAPVGVPEGIGDRAVWLALGPTQLHLLVNGEAAPASGHVALVVPDYDATVARLEAAGHAVEPRREHWGAARGYVRDPAGNLVELMARAPGDG
jgi:catechol 2,3-dioxygenase-like lactoylglutathione lyase family enzyme